MTDAALLAIFRDETAERLDRVVEVLLAVEAGEAPEDAVDSLFRDLHSVKGNAGMVGFEDARRVAHAMEDILQDARAGGELPTELVEALLHGTDAIRRAVAGEDGDIEAALGELARTSDGGDPHDRRRAGEGDGGALAGGPPAAEAAEGPPAAEAAPAREAPTDAASAQGAPTDGTLAEAAPAGPAASLRVAAEKVDRLLDAVGEAGLHRRRIDHLLEERDLAGPLEEELDRGARLMEDLQDAVLDLRTLPLSSISGRFPRAVRDLARREGKQVELRLSGVETQLDRGMLDGISETVTHLLNNAVVHGIEAPDERVAAGKPQRGRIDLSAEQRGAMVAIEVVDDGRGVPAPVLEEARRRGSLTDMLAAPGFSTAEGISATAGRGVGLDAVKAHVEGLGGGLELHTDPGSGTRATLLLPLTLALMRVLLLERGGHAFGLPLGSVVEALGVERRSSLGGHASIELRGERVPLGDLATALGAQPTPLPAHPPALVVTAGGAQAAAACDSMLGEQELVVKSLGSLLAGVPGYLGAGILGDGRVALVLDPTHLVRRLAAAPTEVGAGAPANGHARPEVLVVDDQYTVRELQRSILETAGYRVQTARHGREALDLLADSEDVEVVVTDLEMPELDGLGLIEAIRADPGRSTLPVVIVSSRGSEEDRRRGAEAGADAYIVKQDFDQRMLIDSVARLVSS